MKLLKKDYIVIKTLALFLSILSLFYVVAPTLDIIQKEESYKSTSDAIRLADNSISGNVNTRTITAGNGFYEEYQYNSIDKVEKIWYNYDDGSRTNAYSYDYNANGKLSKFTNHIDGGSVEYDYDSEGKLVSVSESKNSNSSYVNDYTIEYDGLGRVSEVVNKIDYLALSQLFNVSIKTTRDYDSNGSLHEEQIYFNQNNLIKSECSYDDLCRITQLYNYSGDFRHTINYTYYPEGDYVEGALSTHTSNVNGSVTEYTYSYDYDGNITGVVEGNGNTISYTYNDLSQLVTETHGDTTTTYTYDDFGNITSITVTVPREETVPDPGFGPSIHWSLDRPQIIDSKVFEYENSQNNDRLTSINGTAITYDDIGNPLNYYNGTSYYFTWEGNRLSGATSGAKIMSFSYNDEGVRTKKTINGVATTYYLCGSQIISEKTDTRTIFYIYDTTYTPIGMMYRENNYAENVFDVFWFEKNIFGDIIAVYNSNGTKLITYTYTDSWGNHTVSYSNGGASTGAIYNPFRHRSYYYDTDLEMYYLESRYYDAKICRFISPYVNPDIEQGTPEGNTYSYCFNNPLSYISYCGVAFMPFRELTWFGEIHREIQVRLRDKHNYIIEVPVEDGNEKGRIDLVKGSMIYEIKPFTTLKPVAEDQLQKYIRLSNGRYVVGEKRPELTGKFTSKRGYKVRFYYMGNGIIQYGFNAGPTKQLSYAPLVEKNEEFEHGTSSFGMGVVGVMVFAFGASYALYRNRSYGII